METTDLTEGSVLGKLSRFFFPVLFGLLLQQLYNTVDAIVVGQCVGAWALAAVGGSPAMLTNLVIGFFTGLSSGASVVISQYFGSRDYRQLALAEHTMVVFCLISGVALTVLCYLLAPWALEAVKTPEDIMEPSLIYLRTYLLGISFLLFFNVGSGILRAVGDSRWPLVFLGLCCMLNITLDLLFVAVLSLGVAGAAWATTVSFSVSAAGLAHHLSAAQGPYQLRLRDLRISPAALRRVLYVGVPAGVQSSMYSISNLVIQSAVNSFGTTAAAAWTAIGKLDGMFWVTSNAFGVAICTFVGQCFGAGKYDRMREGVGKWLLAAMGACLTISVFLLTLGPWALRIFSGDAEVIEMAAAMLWYFAPFYPAWIFIEILSNTLRGAGDVVPPTAISLLGVCLLRIVWITLVTPHWNTIGTVSMSYPVTWLTTAAVFILYYWKGHWLERCAGHNKGAL